MNRLAVFMGGELVGDLTRHADDRYRFAYSLRWLEREGAIPLSRSLPLSAEPYEGSGVRSFFAGILPEAGVRTRIARILGISERNDFAMLERIGGECAGAVSLLPEGEGPRGVEHGTRELTGLELERIIEELPRRPLMAGEEGVRLSLAGAQDKLPVIVDGDTVSLPLGNTPSTHIIKPEPEEYPGLVANELLCMTLARKAGLDAAAVAHRTIGGKSCLVVERYDRRRTAPVTTRLHQEDFCQALGLPPERKYQQEGGPTVRDCVELLRDWSTVPVLDIRAFVDSLIFNLLIGNADAHGKNYSFLYREGARRLAPFYDLVATIAWPELSKAQAMRIGRGKSINDLNPAHFKRMAVEASLGWPMIRERIEILAAKMIDALPDGTPTDDPSAIAQAERVVETIRPRCRRMLESLAATS